jgi:hypothetical protein
LGNQQGVDKFVTLLRTAAHENGLSYFDRTEDTTQEYDNLKLHRPFVLNIGALRKDGMGVTASAIGGAGYQIALGFSAGTDTNDAHQFATYFLSVLRQRWPTEVFPGSQGVKPSEKCG